MPVEWSETHNEFDSYLDRKSEGIDMKAVAALESALQGLFAETQGLVHVISGRLRESGRTESSVHDDVWTGEIIYGNEIADYAWYEMRRGVQNGRDHNFMRSVEANPEALGVAFRVGIEE